MHRLPLLIAFLLLAGCAPKPSGPPVVVDIKPAPKARLVDEPAEQARASTAEIGRSAAVIAQQTANVSKSSRKLAFDLDLAVKEVDRMRKVEQLTQEEKDNLWKQLMSVRLEHEDTVREVDTLQNEVQRLQGLQRVAEQRTAEFAKVAMDKQAEAEENARLIGLSKDQTKLVEGQRNDIAIQLATVTTEHDKMKGRLVIYDSISIGLGIIAAIYLLVRFVGPLVFPQFFAARKLVG